MFEKAGKEKGNVQLFQFWQHHNKPIELWSEKVINQKIDYIHNNPITAGFVSNAIDWKYSSARNFQDDHNILERLINNGFFNTIPNINSINHSFKFNIFPKTWQ